MKIQISGQYGDPKADDIYWPIQKKLNDCFKKYLLGSYFQTIALLSIVFRVSGKVRDFGAEGPERMKYIKKRAEITIDLVFPEHSWRGIDKAVIMQDVASGVLDCVRLMREKAESLGELKNWEELNSDIEKAIAEFKES